jgi:hypothetical protein
LRFDHVVAAGVEIGVEEHRFLISSFQFTASAAQSICDETK